jgi:filamentous hemagglutinin family protein
VTPDALVQGDLAELIEGGAIRGGNLFHSFLEFNVDLGQRVYFANPVGVESILSRVTGGDPSAIFGTLGVDGAADLFLINPNGIVFGENASLDIQGSFYATTAEAIPLGEGVYSATAPEQSSLLTVDPSALFSSYLSDASGDIENRGQLAAGENLTLAGNNLDLQGQVAAGGDLTLLGNVVQIRDTTAVPFVGFAGGDLLVQGNEGVDIVALSHPESGLYSYGDMVLRSANPVGGDAHYWSGGSFRVENLDGSIGDLFSPVDPIIRTFNDVVIDEYEGSSLHILAGGSVRIGTAEINAPDAGQLGIDFLQETLTLSDGTVVQIDGGAQPTLDIRAGIAPEALGEPPLALLTGFNDNTLDEFRGDAFVTAEPSNADITVGDVFIDAPNGLVLLTNQYQPNTALTRGSIFVTGDGIYGDGIDARGFGGQGGAAYLDARSDVSVINSSVNTTGVGTVGDVVINATGTVRFDGTDGNRTTGAFTNLDTGGEGTGGNVSISAANLEVLNGAQVYALVLGTGQGGDVELRIRDTVRFVGTNPKDGSPSGAFSSIQPDGEGAGGNVQINARTLEVEAGAQLSTFTFGMGDAGSVILDIGELVRLDGVDPVTGNPSGIGGFVGAEGIGQGGSIAITASSLEVTNGARLSASTFGSGNSGNIVIDVTDTISIDGVNLVNGFSSEISNSIVSGGLGNGGDIAIRSGSLLVTNGGRLSASNSGSGDGGNILIDVEDEIFIDGLSGISSSILPGGLGNGGNIDILAGSLGIANGGQLSASTFGSGDSGNITISVTGAIMVDGVSPVNGISVSEISSRIDFGGQGNGGDIEILSGSLLVTNGGRLIASNVTTPKVLLQAGSIG